MVVTGFLRQTEGFVLTLSKTPPGVSLTYMKVMLIYSLMFFLVELSNKNGSSVLGWFYFKIWQSEMQL